MDNGTYSYFLEAKRKQDINLMRKLYENNMDDSIIKFEYGKMLAKRHKYSLAKPIFEDLIKTKNNTHAILELGRLEYTLGNVDRVRKHLESLLNTEGKLYAINALIVLSIKQKKLY